MYVLIIACTVQIWQTTRSARRTRYTKARLVVPRCFVLTKLPLKEFCFVNDLVWWYSGTQNLVGIAT